MKNTELSKKIEPLVLIWLPSPLTVDRKIRSFRGDNIVDNTSKTWIGVMRYVAVYIMTGDGGAK